MRHVISLLMLVTHLPAIGCAASGALEHGADQAPAPAAASVANAEVDTLIDAAQHLSSTGRPEDADSAAVLLRGAIAAAPDNVRALDALATVHWLRVVVHGRPVAWLDSAVVLAERVVRQTPARGWYLLGRTYGFKGEQSFAVDAFKESLRHDSTYTPAMLWLGYRYFDMGRHDRGIPWQMKAMARDSTDTISRHLLGFSYFHIGLPDLGEAPFEEALDIRVTEHGIGGPLLLALSRGDYADAIAFTDSMWRSNPEPAYTWARLGEAHFFAGNAREAERFFAGALERDSASTNQYTWKSSALPLAYLYIESGRDSLAAPLIRRSYTHADDLLKQGQEPWNAYYQYAVLALLEGDRQRAIRWLRVAHLAGMPGPTLIETDPLLAGLRGDTEFREVVDRLRWREAENRKRLGLDGRK